MPDSQGRESLVRLERRRATFVAVWSADTSEDFGGVGDYVNNVVAIGRRLEGAVGFVETEWARHKLGSTGIERQTVAVFSVADGVGLHHSRLMLVVQRYRDALELFGSVVLQLPVGDGETDRSRLVGSLLRASADGYRSLSDEPSLLESTRSSRWPVRLTLGWGCSTAPSICRGIWACSGYTSRPHELDEARGHCTYEGMLK